jgi:peptidoglycan/LPS O-acetylase OafA/YrhL
MMGIAFTMPVIVARMETGRLTGLGIGFVAAGCGLVAGGVAALVAGFRRRPAGMPSSVRAAVAANVLVLGFLALELSDRSVRQDGNLFYWTTFLLPPALLLFVGLVAGKPWSWWAARGVATLGTLWFLGFLVIVPFAPLRADGIPAPWYGRVYMAGVTVVLAVILASAFRSLGSPEARRYFGVIRSRSQRRCQAAKR